jgi:hypothetical protein
VLIEAALTRHRRVFFTSALVSITCTISPQLILDVIEWIN